MLRSSARDKGNRFEYDTEYSLKPKYPDIRALEKRGMAEGYDLVSIADKVAVECKAHHNISWNELKKIYDLIQQRAYGYTLYVVFKTNRQPVLVFDGTFIMTFDKCFNVPFLIRPKKSKEDPK
jgi:hypothetical protein